VKVPGRLYRSRAQGFTLLELVVAMTLFGLLTGVLYGAFYLGSRAIEKAEAASEANQQLRSAADFLGNYIHSAYPYHPNPRDQNIFFSGESDSLTFVSALSIGLGGRGLSKISVSVDSEDSEPGRLMLEETMPVRVEDETGGVSNSILLGSDVRQFKIEYLDPKNEEETWLEAWNATERRTLPRAVRMEFLNARNEKIQWVFPIMLSVLTP